MSDPKGEPTLPPEQAAIRTAVAMARTGTTQLVRLRGEGARQTALWALASRLHLRDAQARQSLLLDEHGHPIADVLVCADDEDFLLLVEGPVDAVTHLRTHARGEVAVENLSEHHDVIELHGPWAWELVAEVLGSDLVALPYLNFFRIDAGYCVRAGRTGEFGYHVIVERAHADALYARFLDMGRAFDLVEVGRDALSLAGFENWFFDPWHVPPGATPIELQLEWRLADDRDHLGRAALEQRRPQSTHRLLCLLCEHEIAAGDAVVLGKRAIGEIVRAAWSHARGEWIASALVERAFAHGGIDRFAVRGKRVRSAAPPLIDNRSLYVDPRRHSYRTREELRFGPLARQGRAAMWETR